MLYVKPGCYDLLLPPIIIVFSSCSTILLSYLPSWNVWVWWVREGKSTLSMLSVQGKCPSVPVWGILLKCRFRAKTNHAAAERCPMVLYGSNVNRMTPQRVQVNLLFKNLQLKGAEYLIMHIQSRYTVLGWRTHQLLKATRTNILLNLNQRLKGSEYNGGSSQHSEQHKATFQNLPYEFWFFPVDGIECFL